MIQKEKQCFSAVLAFSLILLACTGYLLFERHQHQEKIEQLLQDRNYFLNENASSSRSLEEASTTIASLEAELLALKEEYGVLTEDYEDELSRNEDFDRQIKKISKTVGVLDKLSKTDEELLQKYSKVYFLNEHYVPEKLSDIDKEYLYDESRSQQLHTYVMPFFVDMVQAAKADGVDLYVVSAYRSFQTQAQLKGAYFVTYGSGANTFSADQGYSEHQLGTTVDFTTTGINGGLSGFDNTPAYAWLLENAHDYGFTLSYPQNNAYYIFEPWHWRFVGEDLADDLQDESASFYDWDQRKIDTYLVKIFD